MQLYHLNDGKQLVVKCSFGGTGNTVQQLASKYCVKLDGRL